MILYKNVDIKDLESILQNGILSLNKSGNNNWYNGKRVNNSCDVVYLFKPTTKENSFCKSYGVVLLEIDIEDSKVKENQLSEFDINKGKCIEYITEEVSPELIKSIYIPKMFKDKINLTDDVISKITWCELVANYYGEDEKENCPVDVLEQFSKTAEIYDASEFNFFRGLTDKRTMIDLYDIQYVF